MRYKCKYFDTNTRIYHSSSCQTIELPGTSLLGTIPHLHEDMMMPRSNVFVTLSNNRPSMDERDKHWSMIMHGDDNKLVRIEEDATSGNFITSKPPSE
jgi:hypothetical protein